MPPTQQPVWEFLANLGDRNPLEYGGYFVYEDKTGVYPAEAVLLEPERVAVVFSGNRYREYRVILDRLKQVAGYLVPWGFHVGWGETSPPPGVLDWMPDRDILAERAGKYDAWFHKDLAQIAESAGIPEEELERTFTSEDPLERAHAYRELGQYYGWGELDIEPSLLTRAEVKKKYRKELTS